MDTTINGLLDDLLKKVKKSESEPKKKLWDKIGIELEGGWPTRPKYIAEAVRGAETRQDASVHSTGVPHEHEGEITTYPHTKLEDCLRDVAALYPVAVSEFCGLHIHLSFPGPNYGAFWVSALTNPAFYKHFKARWKEWGAKWCPRDQHPRFWDRLAGRTPNNRATRNQVQYCKAEWKPDEQLTFHNDRYTQVNFEAWNKFHTIETRVLPMFPSSELACEAIKECVEIYNDYLNEVGMVGHRLERNMKIEDGAFVETHHIREPSLATRQEAFAMSCKVPQIGPGILYFFRQAPEMTPPFIEDGALVVP